MKTARITDSDGYSTLVDLPQIDQVTVIPGLSKILDALHARRQPTKTCPLCGWTVTKAVQTGLLGCGICYTSIYPAWEEARQKASASSAQVSSAP